MKKSLDTVVFISVSVVSIGNMRPNTTVGGLGWTLDFSINIFFPFAPAPAVES